MYVLLGPGKQVFPTMLPCTEGWQHLYSGLRSMQPHIALFKSMVSEHVMSMNIGIDNIQINMKYCLNRKDSYLNRK